MIRLKLKVLILSFLFLYWEDGRANVFFDEFKTLHSQGAMREEQKVKAFFDRLESTSSFESMAVLYYLSEVGFRPWLLGDTSEMTELWIEADVRYSVESKAKSAIKTWVYNHSHDYDLNVAGEIANAWKDSVFTSQNTPQKLFAVFLLSRTPLGKWDFGRSTKMRLPGALLGHLKQRACRNYDGVENSARLEAINLQVLLALYRQLNLMPPEESRGYKFTLGDLITNSKSFTRLFDSAREEVAAKRTEEKQRLDEILPLLRSLISREKLIETKEFTPSKADLLRNILDDLNSFWHSIGPEALAELRRIHADRITRGYGDLSLRIDYELELASTRALHTLIKKESYCCPWEENQEARSKMRQTLKSCFELLLGEARA